MWTILNMLPIVSKIQKAIRKKWGYNVCIYGSVLYKGYSKSDLDIQLIPASHYKDKYHKADLVAQAVADSVNGAITQQMKLKAIGEMCYIIDFVHEERNKRIDLVIRRIVKYIPSDEEILSQAARINEKRELLKRCSI